MLEGLDLQKIENILVYNEHASLLVVSGVILIWTIYGAIWRLYLSPLSKFPGPKLAALTYWYEFYYDVMEPGGGLFLWELEKLHKRYGESPSGLAQLKTEFERSNHSHKSRSASHIRPKFPRKDIL